MLRAVVFSSPSELGAGNDLLRDRGLTLRVSTVVDATLIAAPSSTKNARGERVEVLQPTTSSRHGDAAQCRGPP